MAKSFSAEESRIRLQLSHTIGSVFLHQYQDLRCIKNTLRTIRIVYFSITIKLCVVSDTRSVSGKKCVNQSVRRNTGMQEVARPGEAMEEVPKASNQGGRSAGRPSWWATDIEVCPPRPRLAKEMATSKEVEYRWRQPIMNTVKRRRHSWQGNQKPSRTMQLHRGASGQSPDNAVKITA